MPTFVMFFRTCICGAAAPQMGRLLPNSWVCTQMNFQNVKRKKKMKKKKKKKERKKTFWPSGDFLVQYFRDAF